METLLADPALFTHYVALDPSVWWNHGALIDSAPERLAAFDGAPRTLYFASSVEPDISAGAARLATMLRTAAPRGLLWTYMPRPDLTHPTIFRALAPSAFIGALR